ncbi:MAG: hypothetical protein ACXWCM_11690 [Acidimicrobiales bacterium]
MNPNITTPTTINPPAIAISGVNEPGTSPLTYCGPTCELDGGADEPHTNSTTR